MLSTTVSYLLLFSTQKDSLKYPPSLVNIMYDRVAVSASKLTDMTREIFRQ